MPVRRVGLIPAAGKGERMRGEMPKQYAAIRGQPMLAHAVRALLSYEAIDLAFVVLAPDDDSYRQHDWSEFGDRLAPLWCGGDSRRDSVLNGLDAMANIVDPDDWVLVHDAARPCVTRADIARLIESVGEDAVGGILAMPLADTLKRGDEAHRIESTQPRAGLWLAQTPQMFRHGTLLRALSTARDVTDDAAAVERLGLRPQLVRSSARNIKVTYPEDVAIAAALLGPAVE